MFMYNVYPHNWQIVSENKDRLVYIYSKKNEKKSDQ